MKTPLFLEDLIPGQRFHSPELALEADTTGRFGSDRARVSPMQVACMTMRLLVESDFRPAGGILGAGIERLSWPTPAQWGDALHVESEILEVRRSKSRPDRGLAKMRNTTRNAANETVQVMTATVVVQSREHSVIDPT